MRGKRKKQIRAFLIRELGENKGQALFEKQAETLQALIKSETGKSKSQKKALAQTILPSIALYQALTKDASLKAQAYAYVQKYMLEVVAAKKHASTAKMEFIPGFFAIYRHAPLIYGKAPRQAMEIPLTLGFEDVSGTRPARKTAARSYAACSAMRTT